MTERKVRSVTILDCGFWIKKREQFQPVKYFLSKFSISPGNNFWIPAFAGIQKLLAIYDLPQLIENLPF